MSQVQELMCQNAHQSVPAAPAGAGTASPADLDAANSAQEQRVCCQVGLILHLMSHAPFSATLVPFSEFNRSKVGLRRYEAQQMLG